MAQGFTKTIQTELKGITAVATAAQSVSDILTTTNTLSALIFIDFGLDSATAPVGTEFRIETSQKATGNDTWRMIPSGRVITGTVTPTAITSDGTDAAGATTILIGANTPALNDIVFRKHGTIALSEWCKVVAITAGTSYVIQDALTNDQATTVHYNKAEQFVIPVNLENIKRLRVVCNNNYAASSASIVWRCAVTTADSVTVVA